jgi:hypothetical protein
MKKLLLILLVAAASVPAKSQSNASTPSASLSTSEANRLNGSKEPTINGKPYSQWVAEEKSKQLAGLTLQSTGVNPDMNSGNKVATNQQPKAPVPNTVSAAKGNNDGGTATERKVENKIEPVEEKTTTPVQPNYFANPTSVRLVAPEVPVEDKPVIENKPARVPVETKDVQPSADKSVKEEKKTDVKAVDQQSKTKPGQTN